MKSRSALRLPLFVALVAVLGAAEIAHGIWRVGRIREAREEELLGRIERGHRALTADLRSLLEEGCRHALFLARSPEVRGLLVRSEASPGAALEANLLPHVASFPRIDRVRVLDRGGRELVQVFRQGGGVAAMPSSRLPKEPDREALRLAAAMPAGQVAVSGVVLDAERVEVVPEDRKVMHCVAAVRDPAGEAFGYVVLTVYASPLLAAVRRFAPAPGIESFLLDEEGRPLDAAPASFDARGLADLARRAFSEGELRAESGGELSMALALREGPLALAVVSRVPESVRRRLATELDGEALWTVGSTLLVMLVLGLAAVFFVRMSSRGIRLEETERFLERLRREAERYRTLLEGAADMILVVEPGERRILLGNRGARETLGVEEGGTLDGVLAGEDDARALAEGVRRAASEPGSVAAIAELRVRDAAGRERLCDARFVAAALESGPAVQLSLRDRTEQVEMERRLRTADRLGSLGLLTAGVAHEVNNPLAAIGNYLALLDRQDLEEDTRRRYLGLVRHGFDRIRDIVRDLLRFARPGREGAEPRADLGEAARSAVTLLGYARGNENLEIDLGGLGEGLAVAADSGSVEQVLLNLLLNAATAMEGQGRVVVKAETSEGFVELLVEDEGPGIPQEAIERLFDPFFTTGEGTGLGLSVSYGMIQALGGGLRAENRERGGARFVVRLPLAAARRKEGGGS